MAVRYSGDVKITLKYRERENDYRATLTWPSGRGGYHRHTVHVGVPAHITKAVDSPDAYDEAAHAALSFANDEWSLIGELSAMAEDGWLVSRHELMAWGGPLHEATLRRRAHAASKTRRRR